MVAETGDMEENTEESESLKRKRGRPPKDKNMEVFNNELKHESRPRRAKSYTGLGYNEDLLLSNIQDSDEFDDEDDTFEPKKAGKKRGPKPKPKVQIETASVYPMTLPQPLPPMNPSSSSMMMMINPNNISQIHSQQNNFTRSIDSSLTDEQWKYFESYQLPKLIEEYKEPPAEVINTPMEEKDYHDFPLACHICPARFKLGHGLEGHLVKHHSEHYTCDNCHKAFALTDVEKFKLHMFKHTQHNLGNFPTCVQCGASFQRPNGLMEHQKSKGPFHDDLCAQCPEKFTTYDEYRIHVVEKHEGKWKWKCGFCRECYQEKRDLRGHCRVFHAEETAKPTKAKYVPKKSYCDQCDKMVFNLKNHMVSVHGNEQHPCPHCGMVLKTYPRLQKHIDWIHNKTACIECGEMVGVGKMSRHIEQKHTSIYDRKFKCEYCGKGFSDNTKLRDHRNTHTGEKPYKCKFCSAAFASAGTHAQHQKSHLGFRRSK